MALVKRTDVLIVGAGPAGITAAIQLKRYGIPFVIIEKERVGGLLWNANLVENYPGFPNGVSGPGLIGLLEKQIKRIGIEVSHEEVIMVNWADEQFIVETQLERYNVNILVIASGTKAMPFPIPVPVEIQGRVFGDIARLLDVTEKHIVIVGAGDAAFDHALNLEKRGNSVTILNRRHGVKCLPLLMERVDRQPAIAYRSEISVSGVEADETGNRLTVRCKAQGFIEKVAADYLVFAIGRESQSDFLSANLCAREHELTSTGRLYFIGDVRNGLMRQTAIAAGDGLRAAMQIHFSYKDNKL